jgi:hypothetical protein
MSHIPSYSECRRNGGGKEEIEMLTIIALQALLQGAARAVDEEWESEFHLPPHEVRGKVREDFGDDFEGGIPGALPFSREAYRLAGDVAALRSTDVADPASVHRAIRTLERLQRTFWERVDVEALEWCEDVRAVMAVFRRQLDRLRRFEGIDFERTRESLGVCLRLGAFVLGMVFGERQVGSR